MEIPVICRLNDFEGSLNCLNNPSFMSRVFSFSGIEMFVHVQNSWKWGAILITLVAALSSVASRLIRVLIFRLQNCKSLTSSQIDEEEFINAYEEDETYSILTTSSDAADDDDDEDCDGEPSPSFVHRQRSVDGEDFSVAGSSVNYEKDEGYYSNLMIRRQCCFGDRFWWSDFAATSKSVVKLWDGLGLGLDVEFSTGTLISRPEIPPVSVTSPALIMTAAADDETRDLAFSIWDRRIRPPNPAIYAEWRPEIRKESTFDTGCGIGKLFVGDKFTGDITFGDLRKPRSPLGKVTECCDGDAWWDITDGDAIVRYTERVR